MLNDAPNLNFLWASMIVEECSRSGVDFFCVAPGSRSAPLAMAVANANATRSVVHYDERGGAYHALGFAKSTGRPAVFICSSGSAVANALPAVIEAAQSHVPLVVITADRPPELQDTGANQTIDQAGIFGGYVRWHHTLPCPTEEYPPEAVLTAVDQAIYRATSAPAGPVHLNCMYREPLHPKRVEFDGQRYTRDLASWFDGPYTHYSKRNDIPDEQTVDMLRIVLGETGRGVIVAGEPYHREDTTHVERFATNLGWPLFPDIASGLRLGPTTAQRVTHYDAIIESKHVESLNTAELVIHFGRPPTSKSLARFLNSTPSRRYVHVANSPFRIDPLHRVSHRIEATPRAIADAFADDTGLGVDTKWRDRLVALGRGIDTRLVTLHDQFDTAETSVIRPVTLESPEDSVLFLGNSLPIRQADFWAATDGPRLTVAVNRGHSGIDGNIATAAGYGRALRRPVTAVLGDLTVLHDLNSLPLALGLRKSFVLVVLNNDGGGIFSRLPINDGSKQFDRFFTAPHGFTFEHAAKNFGFHYERAAGNFSELLKQAHARGGPSLIEYTSDHVIDPRALDVALRESTAEDAGPVSDD